jgi:Mn-dependent DtxR family transcriptional regulator
MVTQEFLGERLGVRRTTVTLLAEHLQDSGVIKYSRGKIAVVDRAALEACACECHRTIKELYCELSARTQNQFSGSALSAR